MSAGKFIAFEGGEGAGKSTQAKMLADALESLDFRVVTTREPGGTAGAEAIRELLLDPEGQGWNPRAEALLFAAARSDHVEKRISPAIRDGAWVICDRFLDSSRAYQGGGGGLSDADILALHQIGSSGVLPDLTVLIEVSPRISAQRLAARDIDGADRIGGREPAYHARVAEAFEKIARAEPQRFVRIDGNGTAQETHTRVMEALAPLLGAGS